MEKNADVGVDQLQKLFNINKIKKVLVAAEEKKPIGDKLQESSENKVNEFPKNFSLKDLNANQILNRPDPISEEKISALLKGDKKKLKKIEEEERDIPADKFDVRKIMQEKIASNKIKQKDLPKSKLIAEEEEILHKNIFEEFPEEKIRNIIREEIYKIVSEAYEIEEKNKLMTETIHIKIGETIFSGKLTPLTKLKKK